MLFGLYTLILIVGGVIMALVGRINTSNAGEKIRNEAMMVVNTNFSVVMDENRSYREEIGVEREKRARLEERLDGVLRDIDKIRTRLEQVEVEKKALEAEKEKLEQTIDLKSVEYQKLMVSIQARIDDAVKAVRQDYETRITELTEAIRQKDEEIDQLKQQLKEKSHEPQQNPIPADSTNPAPDPQPPDNAGTGSHIGSTTPTD